MNRVTNENYGELPVKKGQARWFSGWTVALLLLFAGSAITQSQVSNTASLNKASLRASEEQAKTPPSQQTKQQKANVPTHVVVKITPGASYDSAPSLDRPSVELDKSLGDDMEWICPDCKEGFDVVFIQAGKKPFKNRSFNKARNKSGKATGDNGTYLYKVIVGGGVLDPEVIIRGG